VGWEGRGPVLVGCRLHAAGKEVKGVVVVARQQDTPTIRYWHAVDLSITGAAPLGLCARRCGWAGWFAAELTRMVVSAI